MNEAAGPKYPSGELGCQPLSALLRALRPDYELIEEWKSRTSLLSRFRSAIRRPSELVVKVCERWEDIDACVSFESARRLAGLGGNERARVIEFIAWSASPPALVSEYVGGEELGILARRAEPQEERAVGELVFAAGELLGRAHLLPIPVGARPKALRQSFPRPVLSAGDFAVYNFRQDAQGRLVYLEPPSKLRVVSAYHDLAWFIASVQAVLPGREGLRRRLQRDFLRGYRRAMSAYSWGVLPELYLKVHLLRRRRGAKLGNWRRAQAEKEAPLRPPPGD